MSSEYHFGIFKHSLESFFQCFHIILYIQEKRGRIVTVGSILVQCLIIQIYMFSKYNFQILANDHLKKKVNWKQLYLILLVIRPN